MNTQPTYSREAVQKAIDRDPRIGKAEAKLIHALLRGNDTPSREEPKK